MNELRVLHLVDVINDNKNQWVIRPRLSRTTQDLTLVFSVPPGLLGRDVEKERVRGTWS
jgi:hypothetical protein